MAIEAAGADGSAGTVVAVEPKGACSSSEALADGSSTAFLISPLSFASDLTTSASSECSISGL
jgi:hypothetical protein